MEQQDKVILLEGFMTEHQHILRNQNCLQQLFTHFDNNSHLKWDELFTLEAVSDTILLLDPLWQSLQCIILKRISKAEQSFAQQDSKNDEFFNQQNTNEEEKHSIPDREDAHFIGNINQEQSAIIWSDVPITAATIQNSDTFKLNKDNDQYEDIGEHLSGDAPLSNQNMYYSVNHKETKIEKDSKSQVNLRTKYENYSGDSDTDSHQESDKDYSFDSSQEGVIPSQDEHINIPESTALTHQGNNEDAINKFTNTIVELVESHLRNQNQQLIQKLQDENHIHSHPDRHNEAYGGSQSQNNDPDEILETLADELNELDSPIEQLRNHWKQLQKDIYVAKDVSNEQEEIIQKKEIKINKLSEHKKILLDELLELEEKYNGELRYQCILMNEYNTLVGSNNELYKQCNTFICTSNQLKGK